jgi:general secretion pathway protein F
MSETPSTRQVSLEGLVVLNDELASLVRAGVPLDRGLLSVGRSLSGRLAEVLKAVAIRMTGGSSLAEALEAEPGIPRAYRAVVIAGIRCGRPAAAMESLSGFLHRLVQNRREIAVGLFYAVIVVVMAWFIVAGLWGLVLPKMYATVDEMTLGRSSFLAQVSEWNEVILWTGLVPVGVVALVILAWRRSGKATLVEEGWPLFCFGWIPWVGAMIRTTRMAVFTDLLAMLVENGTPLDESLVLAAQATGDRRLICSAENMAERVRTGEPIDNQHFRQLAVPPMLAWMITAGQRRKALASALRHAAERYSQRADTTAETARIFLPILFTLSTGALAAAAGALVLFFPYVSMLRALSFAVV